LREKSVISQLNSMHEEPQSMLRSIHSTKSLL